MRVDRLSGRPLEDEFAEETDLPLEQRLKKFIELTAEMRRVETVRVNEGRSASIHGTSDEVASARQAIIDALDHTARSFSREETATLRRDERLAADDLKLLEEYRNRSRRRSKEKSRSRHRT
jgi:hypothetical protein